MNILAIDTSLEACSVGVDLYDPQEVSVRSEVVGRGHAERLFGMIEAMITDAGIDFAAIDRFAVTIGPGSFTGIRVGLAAIRGFAMVTGAPAVGLSTLAVHAETARATAPGRPILAVLEAKNGRAYAQLFDANGAAQTDPTIESSSKLASLAIRHRAVLAGSGAAAIAAEAVDSDIEIAHGQSAPEMRSLLQLARRANEPDDKPRPLYIRPHEAVPARTNLSGR